MHWWIIIEGFRPNIHHITGVDNIESDTISIFPYKSVNKYKPITIKSQCHANELFVINTEENNKEHLPLNILNMQREQQKYPIEVNSKLSAYIAHQGYG